MRFDALRRCRVRPTTSRRVILVILSIALLSGAFASSAYAYQLEYYLGTPSNPVGVFDANVGGVTSDSAFRLFNEATATTSGSAMSHVYLYYNGTLIGSASSTYYYYVYRNGNPAKSSCTISQGTEGRAFVYCDTSI